MLIQYGLQVPLQIKIKENDCLYLERTGEEMPSLVTLPLSDLVINNCNFLFSKV